jgi:hypothetical protein
MSYFYLLEDLGICSASSCATGLIPRLSGIGLLAGSFNPAHSGRDRPRRRPGETDERRIRPADRLSRRAPAPA